MAATTGNTHITDGDVFTQAECDAKLAEITDMELDHDWKTGVNKTYTMRNYEFDGTDFTNPVDGDDYTGAGANDFYPAWRTANPDVTAVVQSDENTYPYNQWNAFTNENATWVHEAGVLADLIVVEKAAHVEMLATVD